MHRADAFEGKKVRSRSIDSMYNVRHTTESGSAPQVDLPRLQEASSAASSKSTIVSQKPSSKRSHSVPHRRISDMKAPSNNVHGYHTQKIEHSSTKTLPPRPKQSNHSVGADHSALGGIALSRKRVVEGYHEMVVNDTQSQKNVQSDDQRESHNSMEQSMDITNQLPCDSRQLSNEVDKVSGDTEMVSKGPVDVLPSHIDTDVIFFATESDANTTTSETTNLRLMDFGGTSCKSNNVRTVFMRIVVMVRLDKNSKVTFPKRVQIQLKIGGSSVAPPPLLAYAEPAENTETGTTVSNDSCRSFKVLGDTSRSVELRYVDMEQQDRRIMQMADLQAKAGYKVGLGEALVPITVEFSPRSVQYFRSHLECKLTMVSLQKSTLCRGATSRYARYGQLVRNVNSKTDTCKTFAACIPLCGYGGRAKVQFTLQSAPKDTNYNARIRDGGAVNLWLCQNQANDQSKGVSRFCRTVQCTNTGDRAAFIITQSRSVLSDMSQISGISENDTGFTDSSSTDNVALHIDPQMIVLEAGGTCTIRLMSESKPKILHPNEDDDSSSIIYGDSWVVTLQYGDEVLRRRVALGLLHGTQVEMDSHANHSQSGSIISSPAVLQTLRHAQAHGALDSALDDEKSWSLADFDDLKARVERLVFGLPVFSTRREDPHDALAPYSNAWKWVLSSPSRQYEGDVSQLQTDAATTLLRELLDSLQPCIFCVRRSHIKSKDNDPISITAPSPQYTDIISGLPHDNTGAGSISTSKTVPKPAAGDTQTCHGKHQRETTIISPSQGNVIKYTALAQSRPCNDTLAKCIQTDSECISDRPSQEYGSKNNEAFGSFHPELASTFKHLNKEEPLASPRGMKYVSAIRNLVQQEWKSPKEKNGSSTKCPQTIGLSDDTTDRFLVQQAPCTKQTGHEHHTNAVENKHAYNTNNARSLQTAPKFNFAAHSSVEDTSTLDLLEDLEDESHDSTFCPPGVTEFLHEPNDSRVVSGFLKKIQDAPDMFDVHQFAEGMVNQPEETRPAEPSQPRHEETTTPLVTSLPHQRASKRNTQNISIIQQPAVEDVSTQSNTHDHTQYLENAQLSRRPHWYINPSSAHITLCATANTRLPTSIVSLCNRGDTTVTLTIKTTLHGFVSIEPSQVSIPPRSTRHATVFVAAGQIDIFAIHSDSKCSIDTALKQINTVLTVKEFDGLNVNHRESDASIRLTIASSALKAIGIYDQVFGTGNSSCEYQHSLIDQCSASKVGNFNGGVIPHGDWPRRTLFSPNNEVFSSPQGASNSSMSTVRHGLEHQILPDESGSIITETSTMRDYKLLQGMTTTQPLPISCSKMTQSGVRSNVSTNDISKNMKVEKSVDSNTSLPWKDESTDTAKHELIEEKVEFVENQKSSDKVTTKQTENNAVESQSSIPRTTVQNNALLEPTWTQVKNDHHHTIKNDNDTKSVKNNTTQSMRKRTPVPAKKYTTSSRVSRDLPNIASASIQKTPKRVITKRKPLKLVNKSNTPQSKVMTNTTSHSSDVTALRRREKETPHKATTARKKSSITSKPSQLSRKQVTSTDNISRSSIGSHTKKLKNAGRNKKENDSSITASNSMLFEPRKQASPLPTRPGMSASQTAQNTMAISQQTADDTQNSNVLEEISNQPTASDTTYTSQMNKSAVNNETANHTSLLTNSFNQAHNMTTKSQLDNKSLITNASGSFGMFFRLRTIFFPETTINQSSRVRIQLCNSSRVPLLAHVSIRSIPTEIAKKAYNSNESINTDTSLVSMLSGDANTTNSEPSQFYIKESHQRIALRPRAYCMLPVYFKPKDLCRDHAIIIVRAYPDLRRIDSTMHTKGVKLECEAVLVGTCV